MCIMIYCRKPRRGIINDAVVVDNDEDVVVDEDEDDANKRGWDDNNIFLPRDFLDVRRMDV